MSDVDERISNIIVTQLAGASASITPGTRLEDIGSDPFKMAELIVSIEEAFGIEIPDDEFEAISTIGELSLT